MRRKGLPCLRLLATGFALAYAVLPWPDAFSGEGFDAFQKKLLQTFQAERDGTGNGVVPKLSAAEVENIRTQITRCWNVDANPEAQQKLPVVMLNVTLRRDGAIDKIALAKKQRCCMKKKGFREMAQGIMKDMRNCGPLKKLPAGKYEQWKDLELVFDPKEMLY